MNALTVNTYGLLERTTGPLPVLSPGKIRVRVKYAGVGFADVMSVAGGYPLAPQRPFNPGYEFMGTVVETGSAVKDIPEGQRVAGMLTSMGGYREYVDIDPALAVPVPPSVDDETAGMLPLNYLTAMALIRYKAKLKSGQTFLIHGASGGVGTAALEIAKIFGLRALGTASPHKHGLVSSLGGIPIDNTNGDWEIEARKLVPGGLDAVFDPFGGASQRKAWKVLAPGGCLVSYGFYTSTEGGILPMVGGLLFLLAKKILPAGKKAHVCGTPGIIRSDISWYRETMATILGWAASETIRPVLHAVIPWHKAEDAHRQISERQVKGKILLDFA